MRSDEQGENLDNLLTDIIVIIECDSLENSGVFRVIRWNVVVRGEGWFTVCARKTGLTMGFP
jgi:hypothetical protein